MPLVNATDLAKHLDLTRQRVSQLEADGVIKKSAGGKFDQNVCRIAYLRWLRDTDRRATKSAAASRVSDARTREIELRIAQREKKLIETSEAFSILDEIIGIYGDSYRGLPARATRDLKVRRAIQAEVNATQERVVTALKKRHEAIEEAAR
jgi:hypothetical protein